jgi:death on curing protein
MTGEPVRLLSGEDLERIATRMGLVVRDGGLLTSATVRPSTRLYGEDMYPGIVAKAAAIMHSIVTHHPLVDGNKRLGWVALVVTLDLNEIRLDVPDDEAFDLTIRVAAGQADLAEIETAVHGWITRQPN